MSIEKTRILDEILVPKDISGFSSNIDDEKDSKDDSRSEEYEKIIKAFQDVIIFIRQKLYNPTDRSLNKWIYMSNRRVYYVPSIVSLVPDINTFKFRNTRELKLFKNDMFFASFQGSCPTEAEVYNLFYKGSGKKFIDRRGITIQGITRSGLIATENNKEQYNMYDFTSGNSMRGMYIFPIYRLNGRNSKSINIEKTIMLWLNNNLIPKFDSNDTIFKKAYDLLREHKDSFQLVNDTVKIIYDKSTSHNIPKKKYAVKSNISKEKSIFVNIKKQLLECDHKRAGLDKYDEKMLSDPNRGHWDLWDWDDFVEDGTKVKLEEALTARNPLADVNSKIVAIDFGTKSTVVAYEDDNTNIIPLQVGSGNYSKGIQAKNYENPTIVQFRNIESFVEAYNKRAGRPNTSWNDITVSHTAFDNLTNSDSRFYYSFLDNIKQWCGSENMGIKLKDGNGVIKDLPPFLELVNGDVNPVEIYAYYLGLYINNMMQEKHIFMNYVMSFPVTYEANVRERMLRSFTAGLKKSLPTALLSDEEAMKHFRVLPGTTEPAAYAATALETYGFDPCDDEEYYYAVFDFGGGTTDFDFGVLKESKQDRYDYDLIHFGANGDKTLGGENLLRLMAFEVFKDNRDKLLNPDEVKGSTQHAKIPFTWAAEKENFAGSEAFIKDSQEAHINMHNLMEKLRPLWEAPKSEEAKKIIDSGVVHVNLFKDDGNENADMTLTVKKDEKEKNADAAQIQFKLSERIVRGIKNFFIALRDAFDKGNGEGQHGIKALSDVDEIAIFLAGNSSKSEIVKNLFDTYIDEENGKARELLGFGKDQKMPKFKLFPALGTDEAYDIMEKIKEERGEEEYSISTDRDKLENPTGKTGVAYGLLKCREGGSFRTIDIMPAEKQQTRFQYYIGKNKKRRFRTVIDRSTELNKWYAFIDASASFDILYTDAPIAATNKAPVNIARQIHVNIDDKDRDAEAFVFIRPISAHSIQYAIAKSEEDLTPEKMANEPITIELE